MICVEIHKNEKDLSIAFIFSSRRARKWETCSKRAFGTPGTPWERQIGRAHV